MTHASAQANVMILENDREGEMTPETAHAEGMTHATVHEDETTLEIAHEGATIQGIAQGDATIPEIAQGDVTTRETAQEDATTQETVPEGEMIQGTVHADVTTHVTEDDPHQETEGTDLTRKHPSVTNADTMGTTKISAAVNATTVKNQSRKSSQKTGSPARKTHRKRFTGCKSK